MMSNKYTEGSTSTILTTTPPSMNEKVPIVTADEASSPENSIIQPEAPGLKRTDSNVTPNAELKGAVIDDDGVEYPTGLKLFLVSYVFSHWLPES